MGVSSGLGTFRGKAAGVWLPLKELGIDFTEMSNPAWFAKPRGKGVGTVNFAWSFWKYRYDAYSSTAPHKGYELLRQWSESRRLGGFAVTSNIDGHWLASGWQDDRVMEIHGSVHFQQCADPEHPKCQSSLWKVPSLQLSIDPASNSAIDPLPACMHCGGMARPNVLMFDDCEWISHRYDEAEEHYQEFKNKIHGAHKAKPATASLSRESKAARDDLDADSSDRPPQPHPSQQQPVAERKESADDTGSTGKPVLKQRAKVVVIEIGAGTAVPSIRWESERLVREFGGHLIRFNPEAPQIPSGLGEGHHSITADSLSVLELIDEQLKLLRSASTSEEEKGSAATPCSITM